MFRRLSVSMLLMAGSLLALDPSRALTQYVHRIWTIQQGGPPGTIYDMLQTPDSFLWLGTQTGLVRFDGVRFVPAETLFSGIPDNLWVRSILPDGDGGLWAGTNESGIYHIRNGVATRISTKDGLPSDQIFCLIPAGGGGLWACTGNGVVLLNGSKIRVLHTRSGPAPDVIRTACTDPGGKLWAGTDGPHLFSLNANGGFDETQLRLIPSDAGVRALTCTRDSIWAGTTAGLIQIRGAWQRLYDVKDGLADEGVLSMHESSDGSLWIGTRGGFSRLRNGEFESFRPQEGLSQSSVTSVYEDHEGSLWVGTKHGLNQFLDGRAIPYTENEGLPSNAVGPILQDSSGGIWVGTLDAGLAKLNGRRFTVFGVTEGLASNMILALADAADGSVWVGTSHGLNLFRDGRVQSTYTHTNGLPSDEIRSLYRDSSGALWVGTDRGLAMFENGRFVTPHGSPRDPVDALGSDAQGLPLFSTEHGLFRVERNGTVREIAPKGASYRNVDAIYRDTQGLVWLGTSGNGLHLLDETGTIKPTQFLMRDGMFDAEIYGILQDADGRMWFACSKGIFSVPRKDLLAFASGSLKMLTSTQYSPTDALRVIECKPGVQPGVWNVSGRLWFSTIRGLIVLDPSHLQRNVPPPPVIVEDPIVNGQRETASQIGGLPPGQKNIEFNYTGLSFLAPARITFRYMLENYDRDWIDAGTRREAFYTNLPPGNFRFRVTACNSDGVCNEQGSSVEFSLRPHIYQRAWFLILLGVLACLAGWLLYQLRIRHLRERFELIVAERSRIARELHDTLIQGFSGITMEMQALAVRLRSSEERSRLEEIIRDAATCLKETRRSVAGLRGARTAEASSTGLAASIASAARQITETKDVRLKLKLDSTPHGLPPEVEYNLLRIASEAVANSVKHSGARNIEVSLKAQLGSLRLSISDDGMGFDPSSKAPYRPGHYGLIGMRERAAQIGAEFEFESAPGRGTVVTVVAPLGRAALVETVK